MRITAILATVFLLGVPAAAAASHESIPPGDSAIDQYTENVPGAGGDKPSAGPGGGSGGAGSESGASDAALPPGVAAALESLEAKGVLGTAVADLARAGAPRGYSGAKARSPGAPGEKGSAGTGGGSALVEVIGQLTGSDPDGMGIALPIILGLSAAAAFLLVLARHRRGTG